MSKTPELASNNPFRQPLSMPEPAFAPSSSPGPSAPFEGQTPSSHFAPPVGPPPGVDTDLPPPSYDDHSFPPPSAASRQQYPTEKPSRSPVVLRPPSPSTLDRSQPAASGSSARPGPAPTQRDDASLSQGGGSSSGFWSGVKDKVAPRDPLNPPPPSFARTADSRLPYGPFPYMALTSKGSHLDAGFPLIAPALSNAAPGQPHPFATHDIQEADWTRFLEDLQIAGRLKGTQRVVAGVLPMTMHIGFAGFFVSRAIEKGMKRRKAGVVGELIDVWNQHFFHPRRMEVVLAQGQTRYSGRQTEAALPDAQFYPALSRASSRSSSSSSSSSDSLSDHHHSQHDQHHQQRQQPGRPRDGFNYGGRLGAGDMGMGMGGLGGGRPGMMYGAGDRRAAKRERREMRRAEKAERRGRRRGDRSERRERKREHKEPWRLVVIPL